MRAVYVAHDGATVRREGERLIVTVKRERRQDFSVAGLSQVVLMGNVALTPGAMSLLVDRGVDTVLLGHHGKYRGRLVGHLSSNVGLRLAQYRALTDERCVLDLATRFASGKLTNQRALLLRHARGAQAAPKVRAAARAIRATRARLALVETLDQARGCEGAGAAAYFGAFDELVRPSGLGFDGRNRRPPLDPINALLSFGYTLLANLVEGATEVVGLDPYLGALHDPVAGRPSLVCDLMEEHRVPVVKVIRVLMFVRRCRARLTGG